MNKIKSFLDRKIVTKDVGEETYITWREALSYAMGRGAQGMSTSMTASKYVNFFITDVLHIRRAMPLIFACTAVFLTPSMTQSWA